MKNIFQKFSKFDIRQNLTNPFIVCLLAFLCCFLWGSAFPTIKIGYEQFHLEKSSWKDIIIFAGVRFTLAGCMVILLGSLIARTVLIPKSKKSLGRVLILCMMQTILQYIFFYIGLQNTSGVKASILDGTNVFFSIVIAGIIFRIEKITIEKWIGCILGFIGVLLVNLNGQEINMKFSLNGEGFILLSSIAYGFSSVLLNRFGKKDHAVMLSGWQFFFGGIFMIVMGRLSGGKVDWFYANREGYLVLGYLILISSVAYTLWGILLKYNDVSKVTIYGFFNPVMGVVLSAFLLDEGSNIKVIGAFSLVLVSIGIYIVNRGNGVSDKE